MESAVEEEGEEGVVGEAGREEGEEEGEREKRLLFTVRSTGSIWAGGHSAYERERGMVIWHFLKNSDMNSTKLKLKSWNK